MALHNRPREADRRAQRGLPCDVSSSVSALRRSAVLRRARAELSRIFARIIQARRESKVKEEDILQCFIDSRYEKVDSARSSLTSMRAGCTFPLERYQLSWCGVHNLIHSMRAK